MKKYSRLSSAAIVIGALRVKIYLTDCILLDSSFVIRWMSPFVILVTYCLCKILLATNVDPNQTPHHVASDHGLHCLPMIILRVV